MDEKNNLKEPRHEVLEIPERLPQAKISKELLILGGILILAIGLTVGYYFSQSSKPIVNSVTPSPIPSPKASDEMEGWKTYVNTNNAFSLKYPSSWVYKEGVEGPEFAPTNNLFSIPNSEVFSPISVWIKTTDNFDLSSTSLNQYEEKSITISGINTNRISGIHKATGMRITGVKFIYKSKIFMIITFLDDYTQTFDQILSTFEFVK